MPTLRQEITRSLLSQPNWRNDMPPCWHKYIDGIQLDYRSVNESLNCNPNTVVFPGRRNAGLPNTPPGWHIFRAFDGLCPENVKVVIIGQDPYASRNIATGLAFECGNMSQWRDRMQSSMRRIMQHWADYHHLETRNQGKYVLRWSGAAKLKRDLRSGRLNFALQSRTPSNFFGSWKSQGVLMLNTALTYTENDHQAAHCNLWAPVIRAICYRLANWQQAPMIFLTLGLEARTMLNESGVFNHYGREKVFLLHSHPARGRRFLDEPNIFRQINQNLEMTGRSKIRW